MMNKRLKAGIKKFHKENTKIRFCLGTLALILFCVMLLVIATFTQIKINVNIPAETGLGSYMKFEYIPQIPVVVFIATLLGECWGLMAVLIYIILGLTPFYSLFALGGGLSYVFQYNFGYIFAYIPAVIMTAKELKKNSSIFTIILAVLYGVLAVHVIGTIYMAIIALIRHDSIHFVANWIYYQSLSKILYDIVFGILALIIAKGCRKILWLIMS